MIRIIVERHCRPGKETQLENLLVELRSMATRQRGYISGETLRSVDDPSLWLVISTWTDVDMWNKWKTMVERLDIARKIEPLLVAPEKASVFSFVKRGGAESAHTIDKWVDLLFIVRAFTKLTSTQQVRYLLHFLVGSAIAEYIADSSQKLSFCGNVNPWGMWASWAE
jgi:heme-degrading monooxygenase HmoA